MTETDWLRTVRRTLEAAGWLCTRVNAGGRVRGIRLAGAGTADLLCCAPRGRYAEVETKHGTKQSEAQRERSATILHYGGTYRVVETVEQLQSLVREMA